MNAETLELLRRQGMLDIKNEKATNLPYGQQRRLEIARALATDPKLLLHQMDRILGEIERCPVPTIAAINGFCTGGGAAIAAVCDLRIGSASAQFGFPIARTLGNCLSMANYARLAALIGPQRVKEMVLLAKLMDAPAALACGLISELLPDQATLLARAEELANIVAGHAPITMQVTKEALRRLQARLGDENIDDLVRLAYGSADFREGMAAFLGKRAPKWSGA